MDPKISPFQTVTTCCRYTDATNPWTLDYPPFFAWFEWLLSLPAAHVDPGMLRVQQAPYLTAATKYYQVRPRA